VERVYDHHQRDRVTLLLGADGGLLAFRHIFKHNSEGTDKNQG